MKNLKNLTLLNLSKRNFKGENRNILIKIRECWKWKIKE